MERQSLLIVGASARAAVHSALRAGFAPIAVDLFGDRDLRQVAAAVTIRRWPADVPGVCRQAASAPWMYTGALENHPRIVAAVSALRPLWGNSPAVLRRIRDPVRVATVLRATGLPALEVRAASDPPPADGRWLLKPRRGAAGHGIHRWTGDAQDARSRLAPHYFQRIVPGLPLSAVFVGLPPTAKLLGISRQWIGVEALSAGPFAYCGSIGPLWLAAEMQRQIERTGDELARCFSLRGLFGIDFVQDAGIAFPVEVNPRYTASVEVLEQALGVSAIALHAEAFGASVAGSPGGVSGPRIVAKAILYAPENIVIPALDAFLSPDPIRSLPDFADLPETGAQIPRGRPICTVLAAGTTREECLRQLNERLALLRRALKLPSGADLCL
jgi:predicted ATP-grasp superfamily ATP-dependent carboligase